LLLRIAIGILDMRLHPDLLGTKPHAGMPKRDS